MEWWSHLRNAVLRLPTYLSNETPFAQTCQLALLANDTGCPLLRHPDVLGRHYRRPHVQASPSGRHTDVPEFPRDGRADHSDVHHAFDRRYDVSRWRARRRIQSLQDGKVRLAASQ